MRLRFPALFASVICAALGGGGCTTVGTGAAVGDARDQFMATLGSLCGQRFEGAMTYPPDPKHDFAGKRLLAHVATCNSALIRVPFIVGEDRSRTWILTRSPVGLQLQHDHRHADGTPDAVTLYGGMARANGSALTQSFAADDDTGKRIPGAASNVWTLSFSADGSTLTYHLVRDAKPRFTAVLRRVTVVPGSSMVAQSLTKRR